jgi:hypothetical protein
MDRLARTKSHAVWNRDVPCAWLTHKVPNVREADLPEEVGEDLTRIQGGTR